MSILELLLDLEGDLKVIFDRQIKIANVKMRKRNRVKISDNAWKYTIREIKRTASVNYLKNIKKK